MPKTDQEENLCLSFPKNPLCLYFEFRTLISIGEKSDALLKILNFLPSYREKLHSEYREP